MSNQNELNKAQYLEVERMFKSGIKEILEKLETQDKLIQELRASVLMLQVKNGMFAMFFGAIGSFITGITLMWLEKRI